MSAVVTDALQSAHTLLREVLDGCDERFEEQATIAAEVRAVIAKLETALDNEVE